MKRTTKFGVAGATGVLAVGVLWAALGHTEPVSNPRLQVKFENDRVRVLELHLRPGEREEQHTHPQYVLYALTDYRVRNTKADGTVQVFDRKAGDVFWGEPVTHGGENTGSTHVRAVIVELKPIKPR